MFIFVIKTTKIGKEKRKHKEYRELVNIGPKFACCKKVWSFHYIESYKISSIRGSCN